jgi:hypothetical protein
MARRQQGADASRLRHVPVGRLKGAYIHSQLARRGPDLHVSGCSAPFPLLLSTSAAGVCRIAYWRKRNPKAFIWPSKHLGYSVRSQGTRRGRRCPSESEGSFRALSRLEALGVRPYAAIKVISPAEVTASWSEWVLRYKNGLHGSENALRWPSALATWAMTLGDNVPAAPRSTL